MQRRAQQRGRCRQNAGPGPGPRARGRRDSASSPLRRAIADGERPSSTEDAGGRPPPGGGGGGGVALGGFGKTKVVATIGPSTQDLASFEALAEAGLSVARLNFSHGTHEWHKGVLDMVHSYNERMAGTRTIGTMLDTKGPEVRSGDLSAPVELRPGERYTFTGEGSPDGSGNVIGMNYPGFVDDVEVGDILLVDGGEMSLRVSAKDGAAIVCECVDGGTLKSRRHLNGTPRAARPVGPPARAAVD